MTAQVDDSKHVMLQPEWLQFINHSCDPNIYFDTSGKQLMALRDIAPGDELVFFYPSTEWDMSDPFQCRCSAACCCGTVSGAACMDFEVLARHRLSPYILRKLQLRRDLQQH
jgi:hypothetical protein